MSLGIETIAARGGVEARDPVLASWQEQIRAATDARQTLWIAGGGSKAFYGRPVVADVVLDTRAYRGIVAYEPTELVITARCGTPLAEIEATLAERNQMLAFEPPRFGHQPLACRSGFNPTAAGDPATRRVETRPTAVSATGGGLSPTPTIGGESCPTPTLGGVVAAGLSGPRRMAAGAVRDFVLGVELMNGAGELLVFGGQVMKNVAGYDVSRLMAGSLGTLGLLAEVSLKVVPRPRTEVSLSFEMTERDALARLNQWAGQPLPLSASMWHNGRLVLRLSGAVPAVAAARARLGGELMGEAAALVFWDSLRDQTHPFFAAPAGSDDEVLFRLALPDTAPSMGLPGPQLIEWGGAQRWCRAPSHNLQKNRDLAAGSGGHATVFRAVGGSQTDEVFTPLPPSLLSIHREMKRVFDPAGVFNRGRMYKDY